MKRLWNMLFTNKNRIRRNIAFTVFLFLAVFVWGQITKAGFIDNGLLDCRTIQELSEKEFRLDYIIDEDGSYAQYKNQHIEDMRQFPTVVVVRPTGKIRQLYYNLVYEMTVEEVVTGDQALAGRTITISHTGGLVCITGTGFMLNEKNELVRVSGVSGLVYESDKNIMFPEYRYLAFLESNELQKEFGRGDVYDIWSNFGCLKLDGADPIELVQTNKKYTLAELKDYEFFASSEETLEVLYEIKNAIIKKYYK